MKRLLSLLALAALCASAFAAEGGKKTIVMIAGKQSHGPGEHEHNAGIKLLAKCLAESAGDHVVTKVHASAEWPGAEELAQADTIVIYSDGGGGHPALQGDHSAQLGEQMKRGCGFVCLHYAVEPAYQKTNWQIGRAHV